MAANGASLRAGYNFADTAELFQRAAHRGGRQAAARDSIGA